MTIHLRTQTDSRGDAVEHNWYCSRFCYALSLDQEPPTDPGEDGRVYEGLETGGAWPCGAEHDLPDFCVTCETPIGNPLTTDGEEYVREHVRDWGDIAAPLRREYAYLFET